MELAPEDPTNEDVGIIAILIVSTDVCEREKVQFSLSGTASGIDWEQDGEGYA